MAPPRRPPLACKKCGQPAERFYTAKKFLQRPRLCAVCRERFHHPQGADHPHWRGGSRPNQRGYIVVWTGPNKWGLEHRLVWEAAYGPIPKGMHVHHINHNKADNRLENLCIVSNSGHQALHKAERALGSRWALGYSECMDCGTTERRHVAHGLCNRCLLRRKWVPAPPRMKLQQWARHYEQCLACGRTDREHAGHGLCHACYQRTRYQQAVASLNGHAGGSPTM